MNERIQELAALYASGTLDGPDKVEFNELLASNPEASAELASYQDAAALIAMALSAPQKAPAGLKARILGKLPSATTPPPAEAELPSVPPGFLFINQNQPDGWIELRVPGASFKMLSMDPSRGYAVVLGKLAPGTAYPEHQHIHAEQIFVLSGDLHIGKHRMDAGDFHHADAGTRHAVNHSEMGCTILAVISIEDLQAQMAL